MAYQTRKELSEELNRMKEDGYYTASDVQGLHDEIAFLKTQTIEAKMAKLHEELILMAEDLMRLGRVIRNQGKQARELYDLHCAPLFRKDDNDNTPSGGGGSDNGLKLAVSNCLSTDTALSLEFNQEGVYSFKY
tara:strand:+ start:320 stop:721 length:402 start_codon:yes stop_codon:yes gene_type:complete